MRRAYSHGNVHGLSFSPDGTLLAASTDEKLEIFTVEYRYEFPGWFDMENSEYEKFLAMGYNPAWEVVFKLFLKRCPNWIDEEFDSLITELQNYGFGYLRPDFVRARLSHLKK